ncbi:phage holin family protein [Tissierella carlieri]|nr:phage holin family protein [Tissierella carlieri]
MLISYRLDIYFETSFIKYTVIIGYIVNELLSIAEST